MEVCLKSQASRVKIHSSLADDFTTLAASSTNKISIFLSATMSGNDYVVDGYYVPKQHSTQYIDSIDASELYFLGDETGISEKSRYFGMLRYGGDIGKIATPDIEFFTKSFKGVPNFFGINISKAGNAYVLVENPAHRIVNDDWVRTHRKTELCDKISKDIAASVDTSTSGSFSVTVRSIYKTPDIITKSMKWRDVV